MSRDPAQAPVIPLRRPPVRQSTVVRSDREHTFGVFVRTIGVWWPVNPFSAGKDRVRDVTIEPRTGGRVYETWRDGTEVTWGELLASPTLTSTRSSGAHRSDRHYRSRAGNGARAFSCSFSSSSRAHPPSHRHSCFAGQ